MDNRADVLRNMQVCRFCLCNEESQLTNIYKRLGSDNRYAVPLPLQIMACISIEVFESDGMPQLICNTCRKLTVQAYTFKTNSKKADDALKLFLATGQLAKPFMHRIEELTLSTSSSKPNANNDKQIETIASPSKQHQAVQVLPTNNEDDGGRISNTKENWTMMDEDTHDFVRILELANNDSTDDQDQATHDEDENNEEFRSGDDTTNDGKLQESSESNQKVTLQIPTDCFACPHCDRSFPLQQLLDLHLEMHSRERAFECDTCNRKFFTKYDLQKHLITHGESKPFKCGVCFKTFSRETLLSRHEKTHDNVPKYNCSYCDRTFLNKEFLGQHMEKHRKSKPYDCKICGKSFVFKQGLERHELVHSQNKPHKCNYCEASFTSPIKLTRHITSHAGLRPYPCKLCGRTFLLSHHLTRHMRSHYALQSANKSVVIANQYKCDLCSMSFKRKDSLINHSVIHSMVNLKCVICYTSFENAALVKEHITTHLASLPFPCEKCDYSFETSQQLEEHALKHAEMEYEDQIEKEVLSEALQQKRVTGEDDDIVLEGDEGDETIVSMSIQGLEDDEVQEFTITDIDNPDIVLKNTRGKNKTQSKQQESLEQFSYFLKDELSTNSDDVDDSRPDTEMNAHESEILDIESIKPIIRHEGTKVYQRKSPVKRVIPSRLKTTSPIKIDEASAKQAHSSFQIDNIAELSSQASQETDTKKMKIGEKVVQVRKFILTKDKMKAMAKEGILELKGNRVFLKNPGAPILNATLKSIQDIDIDSMLDRSRESRQQIKQYQKKSDKNDDDQYKN